MSEPERMPAVTFRGTKKHQAILRPSLLASCAEELIIEVGP
jgi:hypothetical protein